MIMESSCEGNIMSHHKICLEILIDPKASYLNKVECIFERKDKKTKRNISRYTDAIKLHKKRISFGVIKRWSIVTTTDLVQIVILFFKLFPRVNIKHAVFVL